MGKDVQRYFCLLLILTLVGFSCDQGPVSTVKTKGIYGNPKPLWDLGYHLGELGINAVFVHSGSIDHDLISQARKENLKVYAEFATLNGKGYVDTNPEAWPINSSGEKAEAASWFMGVCPTEPGFRLYRRNQLEALLLEHDLDGVWLDYIHWHAQFEEPEPILPETCFCDHCLGQFSKYGKIKLPDGPTLNKATYILETHENLWREWRCQVIFDWTAEMRHIVETIRPNALLGLYHCPWTDTEFDSARINILGLDYDKLKESVDVFSPMVYHARMGRGPEWVQENLQWFYSNLQLKEQEKYQVWPIVQAHNDPYEISAEEFGEVMNYGLQDPATGVMMFTSHSVAESAEKIEVMRKIYSESE